MRKYAAATALGITLITMLALTVSASLTPANARGWFCDNVVCLCQSKCPRWLRCDPLIRYQSNQSLLHLEESRLHLEGCERAFSEELGVQGARLIVLPRLWDRLALLRDL
jgi:hypothetical protein